MHATDVRVLAAHHRQVARKVVILARLCGLTNVEMDHVSIESLVPEALRAVSVRCTLIGPRHACHIFLTRAGHTT